jgi:hypothetical protein
MLVPREELAALKRELVELRRKVAGNQKHKAARAVLAAQVRALTAERDSLKKKLGTARVAIKLLKRKRPATWAARRSFFHNGQALTGTKD